MPKLLSKLDPGVAIALAIGLLAIWPLFAYPSLPLNTDAARRPVAEVAAIPSRATPGSSFVRSLGI